MFAEEDATIVVEEKKENSDRAGAHDVIDIEEQGLHNSDVGEILQLVSGSYVRRLGGLGEYSSVSASVHKKCHDTDRFV